MDVLDDYAYMLLVEEITELDQRREILTRAKKRLESEGRHVYAASLYRGKIDTVACKQVSVRRALRLIAGAEGKVA